MAFGDPLMRIEAEVDAPISAGIVDSIEWRMVPILGGVVSGGLTGRVLPGGADWQAISPDGTLEISARYLLALAQGVVEVRSEGIRHGPPEILDRLARAEIVPADAYYFRTAMRFRTGAAALGWMNPCLAIAVGERLPRAVRLDVYRVP